jgi:hypothetical protein
MTLNRITDRVLLRMLITRCPPYLLSLLPCVKKSEITNNHSQLQDDLVEHLWMLKGNNA